MALVLEAAAIPYIAIEHNFERFRTAKLLGHNVVFGDATRKSLLKAAGIARARVTVITLPPAIFRAAARDPHPRAQERPR